MKKLYSSMIIFVIMATIMTGCSSKNEVSTLTDTLGIDFSAGTISYNNDSHGGFHGDGTTFTKISMPQEDSEVIESIESHEQWKPFPLPEDINILIYGKETVSGSIGPYIPNDEPFFPEIKNGYYFFKDRQYEDTDILSRSSFNFTVAIFDVDTNTLYYCEQDT